jgi:hypothetical protein
MVRVFWDKPQYTKAVELADKYTFRLGGINISFIPAIPGIHLSPASGSIDFITHEPGEISVCVHPNSCNGFDLQTPRFETNNWAYFEANGKQLFQLQKHSIQPDLQIQTFIMDQNSLSGDLFVYKRYEDQGKPLAIDVPPPFFEDLLPICLLAQRRGLLLHACGVCPEPGGGLLFSGVSGSGKSTTARIWKGAGAKILSDERVAVRKIAGQFTLFGTPWHGVDQSSNPEAVPLRCLFVIKHGEGNQARQLRPAEAVPLLMARAYLPFWDAEGMAFSLEFLDELCQQVPVYELGFLPDASVVDYVKCLIAV